MAEEDNTIPASLNGDDLKAEMLLTWARNFNPFDFTEEAENSNLDWENLSTEEQLQHIGQFLFEQNFALSEIIEELTAVFPNGGLEAGDWSNVAECLLVYSVTKTSMEIRQLSVEIITSLGESTAVYLAELIKRRMTASETPAEHSESPKQEQVSVKPQQHLEKVPTTTSSFCMDCSDVREKMRILEEQLKLTENKHEEEIQILKSSFLKEQDKMTSLDMQVFKQTSEIFNLEKENKDFKEKCHSLQAIEVKYSQLSKEYALMQDQQELYQSQVEKVETLEKQNANLKTKLSVFNEVHQQLTDERRINSETVEKLLTAESELHELKAVRQQNEIYAKEKIEQELEISSLQHQLTQKTGEIDHLKQQLSLIGKQHLVNLQEKQSLNQYLSKTIEEERESSVGVNGFLGNGLNEFNTALTSELDQLRNENMHLKVQLSKCSVESLNKLEKDVHDSTLLNQSLTQKWNSTKDALARANQEIARLNNCNANLQEQLKQMEKRYAENVIMCQEEMSMKDRNHQMKTENLIDEFSNKIKQLEENHAEEIARMNNQFENQTEMNLTAFTKEKTTLNEQIQLLLQSLEEEKGKRRKAERLKDMFQSESQRQKLQLSLASDPANGSGSGGANHLDVEMAAKELKSMQQSLDTANKEIAQLKSLLENTNQGRSSSITTTTGVSEKTTSSSSLGPAAKPSSLLSSRPQRASSLLLQSKSSSGLGQSNGSNSSSSSAHSILNNYLEQSEVIDRRVEQLEREKREILSRSLEDNKEKMELSQKLLLLDKENTNLKNEIRKVILEKERMERKIMKNTVSATAGLEDKENLINA